MARRNVYFREKILREVDELVQIEIQNGATHGEVNFSSEVGKLVEIGLRIKKLQKEGDRFDQEGFNRELIRKVSGSREGISILIAMISEIYLHMRGDNTEDRIVEMLDENLKAMNKAEVEAEGRYYLQEDK